MSIAQTLPAPHAGSVPEELVRNSDAAATLLSSMAHPKRLLVLCQLVEGERTAGELAADVGLSPSALSQHLAKMKAAGIVASRREGQTLHYRLAGREVRAVMETLYALYCAPQGGAGC